MYWLRWCSRQISHVSLCKEKSFSSYSYYFSEVENSQYTCCMFMLSICYSPELKNISCVDAIDWLLYYIFSVFRLTQVASEDTVAISELGRPRDFSSSSTWPRRTAKNNIQSLLPPGQTLPSPPKAATPDAKALHERSVTATSSLPPCLATTRRLPGGWLLRRWGRRGAGEGLGIARGSSPLESPESGVIGGQEKRSRDVPYGSLL
jgi:hypothetical protein